jgi:hypothetical protein
MIAPGGRWRLITGTVVLAAFGFLPFVALALAALLAAARPVTRGERAVAVLAAALGVGLLLGPATGGRLDAATRTFAVLVTTAFTLGALLRPAAFLPQAVRALGLGALATGVLLEAAWGPWGWVELARDATLEVRAALQAALDRVPDAAAAFHPLLTFTGATVPAVLVLGTLGALAAAWQWHGHIARVPLGPPLAPFRAFWIGDRWVWTVIAALVAWIAPVIQGVKVAALNVALISGALYALRGAAIVAVFAGATGVATGTLVGLLVLAAVLVVPLLVLLPGLWTLGLLDTWLDFRRRLDRRTTAL